MGYPLDNSEVIDAAAAVVAEAQAKCEAIRQRLLKAQADVSDLRDELYAADIVCKTARAAMASVAERRTDQAESASGVKYSAPDEVKS